MTNIPKHPFLNPKGLDYGEELKAFRQDLINYASEAGKAECDMYVSAENLRGLSLQQREYEVRRISHDIFEKKIVELLEINLQTNFHGFLTALREVDGDYERREQEIRYYIEAYHRITLELIILRDLGNEKASQLLAEIFGRNKYGIPRDQPRSLTFSARILEPNPINYQQLYVEQTEMQDSTNQSEEFLDIRAKERRENTDSEMLQANKILSEISSLIEKIYNERFPPLPSPSEPLKIAHLNEGMIKNAYVTHLQEHLQPEDVVYVVPEPTSILSKKDKGISLQSKVMTSGITKPKTRIKKSKCTIDLSPATLSYEFSTEKTPLHKLHLSKCTPENSQELLGLALQALAEAEEEDLGFIHYSLFQIYTILVDKEKALTHLTKSAFPYGYLEAFKELVRQQEALDNTQETLSLFERIEETSLDDALLQKYACLLVKQDPPDYEKAASLYFLCKSKQEIKEEYSEVLKKLALQNPDQANAYHQQIQKIDPRNKEIKALLLVSEYRELFTDITEERFYELFFHAKTSEIESYILGDEGSSINHAGSSDEKKWDEKADILISKIEKFLEKALKNPIYLKNLDEGTRTNLERASALFNFRALSNDIFEKNYSEFKYLVFLKNLDHASLKSEIKRTQRRAVMPGDFGNNNKILPILEKTIKLLNDCPEEELSHFLCVFFCYLPHCYEMFLPHLSSSLSNKIVEFLWNCVKKDTQQKFASSMSQLNILEVIRKHNLKPEQEIIYYETLAIFAYHGFLTSMGAVEERRLYKETEQAWANRMLEHTLKIKDVLTKKLLPPEMHSELEISFHSIHLNEAIVKFSKEREETKKAELMKLIEEHAESLHERKKVPALVFTAYELLYSFYSQVISRSLHSVHNIIVISIDTAKLVTFQTKALEGLVQVKLEDPEMFKSILKNQAAKENIITFVHSRVKQLLTNKNATEEEKDRARSYLHLI